MDHQRGATGLYDAVDMVILSMVGIVGGARSIFIEFHVENDSYFIKLPISELRKTELTLSENGISDENLSKVVEYILIQTFDSVREESWVGVNDTERFQFHVGYFIEYEIQGKKGN